MSTTNVDLTLIKVTASTPIGSSADIHLVKFGTIPSIGSFFIQALSGLLELSIIANQGNDEVQIALPNGVIGTANLIENGADGGSSPVRIALNNGVIKTWALKV